jgi:flagellar hook-associated protein 3 FlgL
MQVSSNLLYDRASTRMSSLMQTATKLQTQVSTGKKYTNPSENVAVAQQIAEFDRKDADAAVYASNLDASAALLQQADSTLGSISEQLQRAVELANKASTGTLDAGNRKVIGEELSSIIDGIVGLGNTKDMNGQPLFGSASGTDAVVKNADGTFTYNAAPKLSAIPIADGLTIQSTETASRVFTSAARDSLAMLTDLANALKSGASDGQDKARAAIDSVTAADAQVNNVRASVGARAARVDMQQTLLENTNLDRKELRSSLEDVDVTDALVQLQKTMTILSATQQSFSKLSNLSLFDYLR